MLGCSVFVRGTQATQTDADLTQQLLQSIGTCEEVTENMMDAVTALSGSGPAYVFVMIEALADGAVKMGKLMKSTKHTDEPINIKLFLFSSSNENHNFSFKIKVYHEI